jgi:hypothetical protein
MGEVKADEGRITLAYSAMQNKSLIFRPDIQTETLASTVREEHDHFCVELVHGVDPKFHAFMTKYRTDHPQQMKLLEQEVRPYEKYADAKLAMELLFAVKVYARKYENKIRAEQPSITDEAARKAVDEHLSTEFGELWQKRKDVDFEIHARAFVILARRKGPEAAKAFAERTGFEPSNFGKWVEAVNTEKDGISHVI